jgi:hypothetical protein
MFVSFILQVVYLTSSSLSGLSCVTLKNVGSLCEENWQALQKLSAVGDTLMLLFLRTGRRAQVFEIST